MPKARGVTNSSKEPSGWMVYCVACDEHHHFDNKRWTFNGDMENPTFSPSMLVYEHKFGQGVKPRCHSFVRNGKIEYLSDCGHEFAGRTLDLPDLDEIENIETIPCTECAGIDSCPTWRISSAHLVGCARGVRKVVSQSGKE